MRASDKFKELLILLVDSGELAVTALFSPELAFLACQMNASMSAERDVLPSITTVTVSFIQSKVEN